MHPTRRWALVSSLVAPVAAIGGWTIAATLQPPGYRSARDTISALAGHGATDRWVMTLGLALLGACHVATSIGARPVRPAGRGLLALGGVATLAVSAFPLPVHGSSAAHTTAATVGFIALALWPVLGAWRGGRGPLRLVVGGAAALVLVALLLLFQATSGTGAYGLTERILVAAEALWPLVVVVATLGDTR